MAKINEWTINRFFTEVCKWHENRGDETLLKKAKEAKQAKGKKEAKETEETTGTTGVSGYKQVTYTVLWSLLALASDDVIKEELPKLQKKDSSITLRQVPYILVKDGCKIEGNDDSQRQPNATSSYFGYNSSWSGHRKKFKDLTTGNSTIKEALTKMEADIEKNKGPARAKTYKETADAMFKDTDEEEIKMSNNNDLNYQEYKDQIKAAIINGAKQIILTGAPGTGKTRMAKEIAEGTEKEAEMGTPLPWKEKNEPGKEAKYELIQFHPSYDYTDFVEGLRPVEDNNDIKFKKLDGIFKSFCRHVAEQNKKDNESQQKPKEKRYFFIIDEINRADLSKVFGELMYCLESDKRGAKSRIQTQYQNLPTYRCENDNGQKQEPELIYKDKDVFADGFYIPENVYIIGTMNDIDRSVESMDYALRRRFLWMEIEVNKNLLKGAFEGDDFWKGLKLKGKDTEKQAAQAAKIKTLTEEAETLAKRVMALNNIIAPVGEGENKSGKYSDFGLNRQYYISQGQFANLPSNALEDSGAQKDVLTVVSKYVWKWRIEPLLREYVRGEDESQVKAFITACEDALVPKPGTKNAAQQNETENGTQADNADGE